MEGEIDRYSSQVRELRNSLERHLLARVAAENEIRNKNEEQQFCIQLQDQESGEIRSRWKL